RGRAASVQGRATPPRGRVAFFSSITPRDILDFEHIVDGKHVRAARLVKRDNCDADDQQRAEHEGALHCNLAELSERGPTASLPNASSISRPRADGVISAAGCRQLLSIAPP